LSIAALPAEFKLGTLVESRRRPAEDRAGTAMRLGWNAVQVADDPVSIKQRPSCFFEGTIIPTSQPAEVRAIFPTPGFWSAFLPVVLFLSPVVAARKRLAVFFNAARTRCTSFRALELQDHQMIVEVTFWIAVVAATRKLGKAYARSGDVLYGPYVSR
jgi:hypothetical protein